MEHVAKVASSVVFVSAIDRSIDFYRDVFSCEVVLHESRAALLKDPGGFQLYLREMGQSAEHPVGGIGVQYLMWATDSAAALQHFERILRERGCHVDTHTRNGVTFIEGRDPDSLPVIIAHPTPDQLPRQSLDPRLYRW